MHVLVERGGEGVDVAGGEHARRDGGDGVEHLLELVVAFWGGADPDGCGEYAACVLFGAGLVVAVVDAGFGFDAGGIFGAHIDLEPVVGVDAMIAGDKAQVGFEPFGLSVDAQVATPAQGFGFDVVEVEVVGAGGFFDADACLSNGQGVSEECGGWLGVAVAAIGAVACA